MRTVIVVGVVGVVAVVVRWRIAAVRWIIALPVVNLGELLLGNVKHKRGILYMFLFATVSVEVL